jgi:hypothetical protein
MLLNTYPLEMDDSKALFTFRSEGKNGSILKVILFQELEDQLGVFNLGFGDYNEHSRLDDQARSNNGDMDKVLNTVAAAAIQFTSTNQDAIIAAKGSTPARTRLYCLMISRYWGLANEHFEIQGYLPLLGWEPYQHNKPYISLQARRWQ